ncbi:MAG TPA: thiamine-phosphate kinase [Rhizomicrobium sp.]|jgi:thiamine-monophosphate kinase
MSKSNKDAGSPPGEFELISEIFAPLAQGCPGAFGLTDDVGVISPPEGCEVVLKTDSVIEGVHFRSDDPASTIGRKALRRALSDLAAKGAEPSVYLLALALPPWSNMEWLKHFAMGLSEDQVEFGVNLLGGETTATPGPLTITVTAAGFVPEGSLIRRKGAKTGDLVFVTGTIGDAGIGLSLLAGNKPADEFLISRYRLPLPRNRFGRALRGFASASIDVSDGLMADLGHIASVSGVRIEVDAAAIPLSPSFRMVRGDGLDARLEGATAGDDYEIAFTAPASALASIRRIAQETETEATVIGRVGPGQGAVLLQSPGEEVPLKRRGYTHF